MALSRKCAAALITCFKFEIIAKGSSLARMKGAVLCMRKDSGLSPAEGTRNPALYIKTAAFSGRSLKPNGFSILEDERFFFFFPGFSGETLGWVQVSWAHPLPCRSAPPPDSSHMSSWRGEGRPLWQSAGVRLNTEMATGSGRGGRTGGRLGEGCREIYQVGYGNRQFV